MKTQHWAGPNVWPFKSDASMGDVVSRRLFTAKSVFFRFVGAMRQPEEKNRQNFLIFALPYKTASVAAKKKKSKKSGSYLGLIESVTQEKTFLIIICSIFLLSAVFYDTAHIAMWIGFFTAAYATVSNDSIQSLGTFIESNKHRKWYVLWLFAGIIFIAFATA